jgi:hypothetical protein
MMALKTEFSFNRRKENSDLFHRGQKKAWAVSVGGYIFSHKSSVYDPGKVKGLVVQQLLAVLTFLLTELKKRIKYFF